MTRAPHDAPAAEAGHPPGSDNGQPGPDLPPRQRQILALLQKGWSNKEIAAELGIGLGTVKQHINALFKKLDVRNRTMAVARGQGTATPNSAGPDSVGPDSARPDSIAPDLAEHEPITRPACGLSIQVPDAPPPSSPTASAPLPEAPMPPEGGAEEGGDAPLGRVLAAVASDFGAVFLPREGGGDLVFGVRRWREHDVLRAVRALFAVTRNPEIQPLLPRLRAGLDLGTIVMGVDAGGAWDGEMVARPLLTRTRALGDSAPPRHLALGEGARALATRLCGHAPAGGDAAAVPARIDLGTAYRFPYRVAAPAAGLHGRAHERTTLNAAVAAAGRGESSTVMIEGEAGIGKTALLATLPALCRRHGLSLATWRCLPPDGQPASPARGHLMHTGNGTIISAAEFAERLLAPREATPAETATAVVALDDLHWLPLDTLRPLYAALPAAARAEGLAGRLIVVTARPGVRAGLGAMAETRLLRLGRLDHGALAAICDDTAGQPLRPDARAALCDRAAGVPLFAVELARAAGESDTPPPHPPLTLLALLVARIDTLGLDRRLLRLLARAPTPAPLATLRAAWDGPDEAFETAVDAAIQSGLVRRRDGTAPAESGAKLAFGHPMLHATLSHVFSSQSASDGQRAASEV